MAQIRLRDIEDKRELRRLIMDYFDQPRLSRGIAESRDFAGSEYSKKQIKTMMHSLDMAGLIHRIRGYGPGAVYQTTDDGVILQKAMSMAVPVNAEKGDEDA